MPNKRYIGAQLRADLVQKNTELEDNSTVQRFQNWSAVLPSLVIPICLGMSMYFGVLTLLETEVISDQTVVRYLTGHPISNVTLAMFCVGVASLLTIGWNVFSQFRSIAHLGLNAVLPEQSTSETTEFSNSAEYAKELSQKHFLHSEKYYEHYFWRRIHEGLQFVKRSGSSAGLEEELKYLSELDQDRQHQRYSLARILIWATPMLGFLGTVLGISGALGGINVGPDNDFQQMMGGLRSSLYVAFDTTALALTLSMILMFMQFFVDRFESQLIRQVNHRSRKELGQHFSLAVDSENQKLLETVELLICKQTALWKKTITAAQSAWVETVGGANEQIQRSLNESIDGSITNLTRTMAATIDRADLSMTHRWEQWQVAFSEKARFLREQHTELGLQTERIVNGIENINLGKKFEDVLRQNSVALKATNELQQTIEMAREWIDQAQVESQRTAKEEVAESPQLQIFSGQDTPAEPLNTSENLATWEDFRSQVVLPQSSFSNRSAQVQGPSRSETSTKKAA